MALLGYGGLQSGVYLGVGADLEATRELLGFYGLSATCFQGELLGGKEEVLRAFPLEEAKAGYGRLSALLGQSPEDPVEAFRHLTRLVHEARKLLFLDPGLPQELLGPDFPGPKVRRLFLSAREELRARAAPSSRAFPFSFQTSHPFPGRLRGMRGLPALLPVLSLALAQTVIPFWHTAGPPATGSWRRRSAPSTRARTPTGPRPGTWGTTARPG